MLHPSPTTEINPTLSRATIVEVLDETHDQPNRVVLEFANTNYKLHLEIASDVDEIRAHVGKMVLGTIHATARKVDPAGAGGRCVDPCVGRPRRVMGTPVGFDPRSNGMVINVGPNIAFWLTLGAPGQRVESFENAEFVTCDVIPGASFRFNELVSC